MGNEWSSVLDLLLFCSICGFLFYAYLLYVIMTAKSEVFKAAFFRIFFVTGLFDLTTIFAQQWVRADMKMGFGPPYEMLTRLMMALTATNLFIHLFGSLLMTLNRYTAVCHPLAYDKLWTGIVVFVLLIADIVISYGAYYKLFFIEISYERLGEGWKFLGRSETQIGIRMMTAAVVSAYELISVLLIIITVHTIKRKTKGHRKEIQEIGLVIFATVSVCVSLVEALYDIKVAIGGDLRGLFLWIEQQYDYYYFIMISMNAYSVILLSRTLRLEVRKRWRRTNARRKVATITW
ncbi:hypothetical protein Y032_0037g3531 [Ancylostoma ceylanicum]|uniref:Serpentine receptor class gamma n=1 Tax=Ancylostoma ceylanicum TaxID=53326 RepID=A0A016UKR3_9BILA|nr:hypothetical protein Y032_0037g3531 [Ancylostoma ceylanicum]